MLNFDLLTLLRERVNVKSLSLSGGKTSRCEGKGLSMLYDMNVRVKRKTKARRRGERGEKDVKPRRLS